MSMMSDISMLTILIQASATVKNQNGDSSLHGYVESQEMESESQMMFDTADDPNFALLDCLSDILVQDTQVLATSYDDAPNFTLVMPSSNSDPVPSSNSNPELDDLHDSIDVDIDFIPFHCVGSANTLNSMDTAVIPNPDSRNDDSFPLDGPLGKIREIEKQKSLWSADSDDPLRDVLE